jgi:multiple sugar transport system substrate-binding protein
VAALEAERRTPDFVFTVAETQPFERWAYEGRLVDLTESVGHFSDLFDADALKRATLLDGTTGRRGLYLVPMGLGTHYVHVWKSLLGRAGFTLADIPKEWDAFWAFWCDQVQPAAREALGRDDVWGTGLSISAASVDTENGIWQFIHAYEAEYVTRDGRLVIDDPEIRRRLIRAVDGYTALYLKGCTPPDSVTWDAYSNNAQFLAQTIVMTPNASLSIPNALRTERPDDYYENVATIDWPQDAYGQPLAIETALVRAAVFRDGEHVAAAKEFVRFLVGEGWLAHYLNFSNERILPPLPKLLDAPFWLDPSDPHRMRSAIQLLTQPRSYDYVAASGHWQHAKSLPWSEEGGGDPWPEAVYRVVADGISPEQAVDEAIARIKQMLAE